MIFRIKFAYLQAADDGNLKKAKMEVFVQCSNYSDAEKVALEIANNEGIDKYDFSYEVIKTKFSADQLRNCGVLTTGGNVGSLIEHYFTELYDAMFIVKANIIATSDNGKESVVKETYLVCGKTTNAAAEYIASELSKGMSDFVITDTKMDPVEMIYLTQSTHDKIHAEYEA